MLYHWPLSEKANLAVSTQPSLIIELYFIVNSH